MWKFKVLLSGMYQFQAVKKLELLLPRADLEFVVPLRPNIKIKFAHHQRRTKNDVMQYVIAYPICENVWLLIPKKK